METKEKQFGNKRDMNNLKDSNEQKFHIDVFLNNPVKMLEHIAECEDCEAYYTEYIEQHAMIKAPVEMKANILEMIEKSKKKSIREVLSARRYQYHLNFLHYSMNVGLAVFGALLFLFLIPVNDISNRQVQEQKDTLGFYSVFSFLHEMDDNIKEASDSMITYTNDWTTIDFSNKGGRKSDKKEK